MPPDTVAVLQIAATGTPLPVDETRTQEHVRVAFHRLEEARRGSCPGARHPDLVGRRLISRAGRGGQTTAKFPGSYGAAGAVLQDARWRPSPWAEALALRMAVVPRAGAEHEPADIDRIPSARHVRPAWDVRRCG